jgi:DNA-binding response OmpR family regulator
MTKKVLIIEDRRENIVFIANNILRPEGWEVITARDGELGLQKATEERPDLIITDLKLPRMHGLDVLEGLRKQGLYIPTIVMTFHGSEETAIRAFRLGAADYLIKPFEIEEMLAAIDRALHSAPASQISPADLDAAVSEKLASQEREIQHLRALVQQQAKTLQERQQPDHAVQDTGADTARWQALLKEGEARFDTLKKQTIAQHRLMSRQIKELETQLAEKDAMLAGLQNQMQQAGSGPVVQTDGQDLSNQLTEKEMALQRANKQTESLKHVVTLHQQAIEKRREEAERLAHELHMLATTIQMWGQNLGDEASEIANLLPGDR